MPLVVGPVLTSIKPVNLQQLTQSLRDQAVFNQHVKTSSPLRNAAIGSLIIAALLFAYNIFSVFTSMGRLGVPFNFGNFWTLLWSTEGVTAKDSVYLYLYVWGAPILLLVGIGLLVAANMTKSSHGAGQYQRYLAGGYVARQEPLGIKFSDPGQRGAKVDLVVLTHPAQSDADFAQMMVYLRQRAADKAEGKRIGKEMSRAHGKPTPLGQLMPDLPATQNLVSRTFSANPIVVMPPASPGGMVDLLKTSS